MRWSVFHLAFIGGALWGFTNVNRTLAQLPDPGVAPTRIMVATGFRGYDDDDSTYEEYLDEVEAVDVESDPQTPCFLPAPYPVGEYGGVGVFLEDHVLVCGGKFGEDNYTDLCFSYNADLDEWENPGFSMNFGRRYSSAIMLSPEEWWVTGGSTSFGDDNLLDVTEILHVEDGSFEEYISLPRPMDLHHVLAINSSHLLLLDARPNEEGPKAWLLGRDERLFTEIAPPTADRYAGPAGLAERADGSSYVVFGGGVTSPDYSSDRSTEILELGSLTWRAGPEAPHGLVGAASLPYGKSFVTVGGSEGGDQGFTDAIYSFDPDEESWFQLPAVLSGAKETVVAVPIPEGFVPCYADD